MLLRILARFDEHSKTWVGCRHVKVEVCRRDSLCPWPAGGIQYTSHTLTAKEFTQCRFFALDGRFPIAIEQMIVLCNRVIERIGFVAVECLHFLSSCQHNCLPDKFQLYMETKTPIVSTQGRRAHFRGTTLIPPRRLQRGLSIAVTGYTRTHLVAIRSGGGFQRVDSEATFRGRHRVWLAA